MCSAVSVFIETKDLIKFSLDLSIRGRRPLGSFLPLAQKSRPPSWKIGEFFLEFHEQLQRNLRAHWIEHGDGSQGRRSKTTFHITQFPTGPRWIVFDDFIKSYELLFKVRDFGIQQFTRCPSPPASYINFTENFPSNLHPQLSLSMFSTFKYMSLIEDRYCR